MHAHIYARYRELFDGLRSVVLKTQDRVICDEPDVFFVENANFFVKAYLISLCSYLEAFLKDIALSHVAHVQSVLAKANIPNNIVVWSLLSDGAKKQQWANKKFSLDITSKNIDEELSGNPYRTLKMFNYIGIDLSACDGFNEKKDVVNSVIVKRNNIIHHNDSASDTSLKDVTLYVDIFSAYSLSIERFASSMFRV